MYTSNTFQKPAYFNGPVGSKTVPHQDNWTFDLHRQVPEEFPNPLAIDIPVRMQPEIQRDLLFSGRNTQSGNHGNFLVAVGALQYNRRLSARRPATPQQWCHQKTAFVQENDRGIQPPRFFLMQYQSSLSHRLISGSFRSTARRVGRWGLHPKLCRIRLT